MSRSVSRSSVGKLRGSIAEQPDAPDYFARLASPKNGDGGAILPLKFRSENIALIDLQGLS